jgi:hypothetical protein
MRSTAPDASLKIVARHRKHARLFHGTKLKQLRHTTTRHVGWSALDIDGCQAARPGAPPHTPQSCPSPPANQVLHLRTEYPDRPHAPRLGTPMAWARSAQDYRCSLPGTPSLPAQLMTRGLWLLLLLPEMWQRGASLPATHAVVVVRCLSPAAGTSVNHHGQSQAAAKQPSLGVASTTVRSLRLPS